MQQLRQHQPGRPSAHDPNLSAYFHPALRRKLESFSVQNHFVVTLF
jgi:hypothetical protein